MLYIELIIFRFDLKYLKYKLKKNHKYCDIMLFLISWSISSDNRVQCWNVFGNMTPADDLKDAGDKIKVLGRWHRLSGAGGVCVCETDDHSALNSWMLNWSPICEISVEPVVDDASARASLQGKPFFSSKTASSEGGEVSEA